MQSCDIENFLSERGVKPTSNRILILRELTKASRAVSLADLEQLLPTMDKASIFRVLDLFASRQLVHVIEDGSRSLKYEICLSHDHHTLNDQHVHFYCDNCRETFCLESVAVPSVELPEGYSLRAVNYVVKGLCPRCGSKSDC